MGLFGRKKEQSPGFDVVACSSEIAGRADDAWVLLVPDGYVKSTSGDVLLNAEIAEQVIRRRKNKGTDLVIDFEHQSVGGKHARRDGLAPAAGWVKEMKYHSGRGLLGRVEWTADGFDAVESKAYRYLSPVTVVNKADRALIALLSAGLTNTPAIVGMEAVAASEDVQSLIQEVLTMGDKIAEAPPASRRDGGEDSGNKSAEGSFMEWLRGVLGLGEDAGEDAVRQAIGALVEAAKPTETAAASETAEEAAGDGNAEVLALREEFEKFKASVETGQADAVKAAHADKVDRLIAGGKLLEYQREFALTLNSEALEAYVATEPASGKPPAGRTSAPAEGGKSVREVVINKAASEFDLAEDLQAVTNKAAYVNAELTDAGLARLTEEERGKLA